MIEITNMEKKYCVYKEEKNDKIWWVVDPYSDKDGEILFTFDKVHLFSFFPDFPDKLTSEQIEIFKKENPTLAKLKVDVDIDDNEDNDMSAEELLAWLDKQASD